MSTPAPPSRLPSTPSLLPHLRLRLRINNNPNNRLRPLPRLPQHLILRTIFPKADATQLLALPRVAENNPPDDELLLVSDQQRARGQHAVDEDVAPADGLDGVAVGEFEVADEGEEDGLRGFEVGL